jgi:hypothetical protein
MHCGIGGRTVGGRKLLPKTEVHAFARIMGIMLQADAGCDTAAATVRSTGGSGPWLQTHTSTACVAACMVLWSMPQQKRIMTVHGVQLQGGLKGPRPV